MLISLCFTLLFKLNLRIGRDRMTPKVMGERRACVCMLFSHDKKHKLYNFIQCLLFKSYTKNLQNTLRRLIVSVISF